MIFTGRIPLKKFQEERPLEYRRLLDQGQLEKYLAEGPSPRELWRARVIGFAAMAVGVALIGAILYAFLSSL